jgi:hypothetical protein
VQPNISLLLLLHQNVAGALEKKYSRLCNPSSFLHSQTLLTTPKIAQKVQIRKRKPLYITHAPCTSLSLAKNKKSIFALNFKYPNRRAKPTNSKFSKGLEENTFISWVCREPPRWKKIQLPMAQCRAENKTLPPQSRFKMRWLLKSPID